MHSSREPTHRDPAQLVACLWLSVSIGLAAGEAHAQIEPEWLTVSVRAASQTNTCANVPVFCMGTTHVADVGLHEFAVTAAPWSEASDSMQFALEWPANWVLQSTEMCAGILVSGNPAERGSTLRFTVANCDYDEPLIRMVMDCQVPGTLWVRNGLVHICDGGGWGVADPEMHATVGSYCGEPVNYECGYCLTYRAATFNPPSLEMASAVGQSTSKVITAWGPSTCPQLVECGQYPPYPCFTGLDADASWLRVGQIDDYHYRISANAVDLAPGTYAGHVTSSPSQCPPCQPSCMDVTFVVLADAAEVEEASSNSPVLQGPFPNPVTDRVHFALDLPSAAHTQVLLVDVAGRVAAQLIDDDLTAGVHDFSKAVESQSGQRLASGVYFLQLQTGSIRATRITILR